MALSKIQSESINLADDYTFTGTVSGAGGGKVLQFKQYESTTALRTNVLIPLDDTVPTSTEGGQVMTAAFTPTSATSDVFILVHVFGNEHSNIASTIGVPLFAGTTHLQTGYISIRGGSGTDGHSWNQTSFMTKHTPGSTNAITYSVRMGCDQSGYIESLDVATSIQGSRYGQTIKNTMTIWEVE
jgi:hypothetical protein